MIEHYLIGGEFGEEMYYILTKFQLHHIPDRESPIHEEQVITAEKVSENMDFVEYKDDNTNVVLSIHEQQEFMKKAVQSIVKKYYVESVIQSTPTNRPSYQRFKMILTRDYKEWLDDEEIKHYQKELGLEV